jgi:cytochrome d ubiquinol oxidase subunit II
VSLDVLWFGVVALFWAGFFVLEGFDFGVGVLHHVVGRTDLERRVAINAIGPLWDGNEVWLIVGAAAIFAAFPGWYATWFSAGYLALMLVLVALIIRGVSFEWRARVDTPHWRGTWSWTLTLGSAFVPLLLGVALGDLLAGLPIAANNEFTGSFTDLLTPYGIWLALTLLELCLLHGATFLSLKSTGAVRERSTHLAARLAWPSVLLVLVYAAWTISISGGGPWRVVAVAVPALAAIAAVVLIRASHEGGSFAATAVAIGGTVAALFANLYPNVMVSSTTTANNLTVAGTASGDYALKVMTVVAAVMLPVVLLYQGWSYWVFRARVSTPTEIGEGTSGAPWRGSFRLTGSGSAPDPPRPRRPPSTSAPAKTSGHSTTYRWVVVGVLLLVVFIKTRRPRAHPS